MSIKNKKTIVLLSVLALVIIGSAIIFGSGMLNGQKKSYMMASWVYGYSGLEELSQASEVIALVRVKSVAKEYVDQGTPFTEYNVEVLTPIFNINQGDTLIVRMTGGPNQGVVFEVMDDPLLKIGDQLIVFCKENVGVSYLSYSFVGGPQGKLTYSNGKLNALMFNIQVKDADFTETVDLINSYINKD